MDEFEFLKMMDQIDEKLRAKAIPIPNRPLHAMIEVNKLTDISFIAFSPRAKAVKGIYDSLTLGEHINQWYELRYGDRLKIQLGPGNVVIMIRGEPWRMVLPLFYGTLEIHCDPNLEKYRNVPRVTVGGKPNVFNILNCIEKFSSAFAAMLTIKERREILTFFLTSLSSLEELKNVLNKPYVTEAKADLESSVSNILSNPPQYGLSKWSSLQFIEKLLKSFLLLRKSSVPRHHDLPKIAQEAQNNGLFSVNPQLLARVQCSAGVRYGETLVTLEEAVAAHHASLELCKDIAPEIGRA